MFESQQLMEKYLFVLKNGISFFLCNNIEYLEDIAIFRMKNAEWIIFINLSDVL